MRSIKAPKLRFPGYRDEWQAKKLGGQFIFHKMG